MGHDPYYKTEFESALRDGKIFLQDGVHFDNIKTLLDDYKPTPIKKVNIMKWNPNIDEAPKDGMPLDVAFRDGAPCFPEPYPYLLPVWAWKRLTKWRDCYGREAKLWNLFKKG